MIAFCLRCLRGFVASVVVAFARLAAYRGSAWSLGLGFRLKTRQALTLKSKPKPYIP